MKMTANQKATNLINKIEKLDGKKFDRNQALALMNELVEAGFTRNKHKEIGQLMNVVFDRAEEYNSSMDHLFETRISIAKDVFRHEDGQPTFSIMVTNTELAWAILDDNTQINLWKKRNDPGYEYTKTSPIPGDGGSQEIRANTHWRERCRSLCD